MTQDDQMELDLPPDDYHEPVTRDNVLRILAIIGTGHNDRDYEACCKFLEPTEDEKQIINDVVRDYGLPDYC